MYLRTRYEAAIKANYQTGQPGNKSNDFCKSHIECN